MYLKHSTKLLSLWNWCSWLPLRDMASPPLIRNMHIVSTSWFHPLIPQTRYPLFESHVSLFLVFGRSTCTKCQQIRGVKRICWGPKAFAEGQKHSLKNAWLVKSEFLGYMLCNVWIIVDIHKRHIATKLPHSAELGCKYQNIMPNLKKYLGRIVFLILLAFFIWRVVESGKNLLSYETVISVSKKYSNLRLHPSLSICVGWRT